jgi:hypothetical protein
MESKERTAGNGHAGYTRNPGYTWNPGDPGDAGHARNPRYARHSIGRMVEHVLRGLADWAIEPARAG